MSTSKSNLRQHGHTRPGARGSCPGVRDLRGLGENTRVGVARDHSFTHVFRCDLTSHLDTLKSKTAIFFKLLCQIESRQCLLCRGPVRVRYYTNHSYTVLILGTLISPWGMRTMRRVEHLREQLPNILLQAMHRAGYLRAQIKEELQGLTATCRSSGRRPRIQNNWLWICSEMESTENIKYSVIH